MKKQYIDHNYFGILFNKNHHVKRNKSVKRTKGTSEIVNVKNMMSPPKQMNLLKSMENSAKIYSNKFIKHGDATHHASSTNYTPKLKSD